MKIFYPILFACAFFVGKSATAQTYSEWATSDANGSIYDTIFNNPDTLSFTFSGMETGAYGNPRLVIYFYGYVYSSTNFEVFNQSDSSSVGSQLTTGIYCDEDSISFPITPANIDLFQSGGIWSIFFPTNGNFQSYCGSSTMRVRLQYDYCAFGTPVEIASITSDTNFVCSHNTASFTVSPAGGTLVGSGLSGLTFNPSGLNPGNYNFTYTGTDAIGCTTSSSALITIGATPAPRTFVVCEGGDSPELSAPPYRYAYSYDLENTMTIDTAEAYSFSSITESPTLIYSAFVASGGTFTLDTITNDNSRVIDHDDITGDDRGGIVVSENYVFVVGDDFTARYDLDLTSVGDTLPKMDGLFSDLSTRKIWTLYDTTTNTVPLNYPVNYQVTRLSELDENLEMTGNNVLLSRPIPMNDEYNLILAGYGKLGLFNDNELYVVDIATGIVDSIGEFNFDLAGSENWSDWGNLGFDGTDYIAYYMDYDYEQILAHNLTTDDITPISQFDDVSDLASFTFNPANNRIYFHYENDGQFGGLDETLGFIDASATIVNNPEGRIIGCPSTIEFTFNTLDLGADTSLCPGNIPFIVEPGTGYTSYTWNGVNNNWNVYPVVTAETVIASVTDAINCVLTDTIVVTFDNCVGLDELSSDSYSIYPNPNNGTFNIHFGSSVEDVSVSIIDTKGRVCHSESFNGTIITANVKTSALDNGIYFVSITTNNVTTQTTIVVQ